MIGCTCAVFFLWPNSPDMPAVKVSPFWSITNIFSKTEWNDLFFVTDVSTKLKLQVLWKKMSKVHFFSFLSTLVVFFFSQFHSSTGTQCRNWPLSTVATLTCYSSVNTVTDKKVLWSFSIQCHSHSCEPACTISGHLNGSIVSIVPVFTLLCQVKRTYSIRQDHPHISDLNLFHTHVISALR